MAPRPRHSLFRPALAGILGATLACAVGIARAAAAEPGCTYEIGAHDPTALILDISAVCDAALGVEKFTALSNRDHWTTTPAAPGRGQFTFDLGAFAATGGDMGSAMRYGAGALVAPAFLLPLPQTAKPVTLRFRFAGRPAGWQVLTALRPDAEGYYSVPLARIDEAGPLVLGPVAATRIPGDPALTLVAPPARPALSPDVLTAWVSAAAESNRRFWARSPAQGGLVILVPSERGGVPFGRVMSLGGAVVSVLVGADATSADLYGDWVLVHELLHLGSPLMRDTGPWLNEGIATFYEPVLRARAGWKTEDEVWREWINDMPRGMPAMTEIGLRNAGRGGIYWGGALFVLMAEMESLQASGGRIGFSDCLRAVLADGADATVKWPTARLLDACDSLLGKPVLAPLAERHLAAGGPLDLSQIWDMLGVALTENGEVRYDDSARLAWLRPLIIWGGTIRPDPIPATGFHQDG